MSNFYPDTDTDSRIFNHKNSGLLSGNNFPVQYPSKFERNPYMMSPSGQQLMDDPMYREQPQMTRQDWPPMIQQQQAPQIQLGKQQSNSIWPEKLAKQAPLDVKASRKKGQNRDSEYSEEYIEGDENQAEAEDATTTEAPKKVKNNFFFLRELNEIVNFCFFLFCRRIENTRK